METPWKKISEWSAINEELEKIWAPGYEMMARRNAIEKEFPWLKGHGANPAGSGAMRVEPLPQPDKEMVDVPPPLQKKIIDTRPDKSGQKKKTKTQAGIEGLSVMNHPRSSDPIIPDQTQTFQGDPTKKINF